MTAPALREISVQGLRKAHFTQLLSYLEHCADEGWYYGRGYYFQQRRLDLEGWLHGIIDQYDCKAATTNEATDAE